MVDESLLTGESVPAPKAPDDPQLAALYSGSLVVHGNGIAQVNATGARTELGKIGRLLQSVQPEQTLWSAYYVLAAVTLGWYRLWMPYVRDRRHKLRVHSVVPEGPGVMVALPFRPLNVATPLT